MLLVLIKIQIDRMRNVLITLLLIVNVCSYGQNMIVNQETDNSYRSYRHNPLIKIESLSDLPTLIQFNTKGHLKKILGEMSDSLHFSQAQAIDLKAIFQKDSAAFIGNAVIPKYIIKFVLTDRSIGIKSYNLSIELDEYGQLLHINWPKEKWDNKSKFIARDTIKQFVLNYAKSKRFDTSKCKVYFGYYRQFDKLCWKFHFPDSTIPLNTYYKREKTYNIILISWDELKILQESQFSKATYPHAIK